MFLFSRIECPACGTEIPVPALLGNFILLRALGNGAMGSVYLGFDQELRRNVAVKVMHAQFGKDPGFVDHFIREARTLAALNHVHVVQIYTCGQEKGQPFMVMELVDGGSLEQYIRNGRPMDEADALRVGLEVVEGLEAANASGLVHGDINELAFTFLQLSQGVCR